MYLVGLVTSNTLCTAPNFFPYLCNQEKRKLEEETVVEAEAMETSEPELEPPAKKQALIRERSLSPAPPPKDKKYTEEEKHALYKCLDYLHKVLSRFVQPCINE